MSREYLGGAVAVRTSDLTGQNFTGAWFALTWQTVEFDYGGVDTESAWWSADNPTQFTVPTYPDNRRVILRANFNVAWNNVAIGTDWLNMGIERNGATVSINSHPGGFEIINPIVGLRSRQILASQGQTLKAIVRWRNTETSVDLLAGSGQTWFEVEILGFVY